jgi:hypothetical protein
MNAPSAIQSMPARPRQPSSMRAEIGLASRFQSETPRRTGKMRTEATETKRPKGTKVVSSDGWSTPLKCTAIARQTTVQTMTTPGDSVSFDE